MALYEKICALLRYFCEYPEKQEIVLAHANFTGTEQNQLMLLASMHVKPLDALRVPSALCFMSRTLCEKYMINIKLIWMWIYIVHYIWYSLGRLKLPKSLKEKKKKRKIPHLVQLTTTEIEHVTGIVQWKEENFLNHILPLPQSVLGGPGTIPDMIWMNMILGERGILFL